MNVEKKIERPFHEKKNIWNCIIFKFPNQSTGSLPCSSMYENHNSCLCVLNQILSQLTNVYACGACMSVSFHIYLWRCKMEGKPCSDQWRPWRTTFFASSEVWVTSSESNSIFHVQKWIGFLNDKRGELKRFGAARQRAKRKRKIGSWFLYL